MTDNVKYNHFGNQSHQVRLMPTLQPSNSTPRHLPKELKTDVSKKASTRMCIAALSKLPKDKPNVLNR